MTNSYPFLSDAQGNILHFVRSSRDTPYSKVLPKITFFLESNGFKDQKTGSVYILLSRLSSLVILPELVIKKIRGKSLPELYLMLLEKNVDDFTKLAVNTNKEVLPFIAKILNKKTKYWNKTVPVDNPGEAVAKVTTYKDAWKKLRYKVIQNSNKHCALCGRGKEDGITIEVDHIKPVCKYPELALDITNLQVLCEDCNTGKGNWDETDWR